MKSSGIGGQAVIEGVMMKNHEQYAVAVRKPDQSIDVQVFNTSNIEQNSMIQKIPIIRGIVNFVSSLILGMKTLMHSVSFTEEEEEVKTKQDESKEKLVMGGTVLLSLVMAIGLFMVIPYLFSLLFGKIVTSITALSIIEGVARLAIFFLYIVLISKLEDIKRVFMYHGAEHKCINCIEHGFPLTIENVKKSSRLHKRCGTSFLLIVMVVSIIFFLFIRVQSPILRLVVRIVLIPIIAGVSYEFIRLAGKTDNKLINFLSKPGLSLQKMTTKEPDDDMIEVGIASVNAVFDWKEYLQENF